MPYRICSALKHKNPVKRKISLYGIFCMDQSCSMAAYSLTKNGVVLIVPL